MVVVSNHCKGASNWAMEERKTKPTIWKKDRASFLLRRKLIQHCAASKLFGDMPGAAMALSVLPSSYAQVRMCSLG